MQSLATSMPARIGVASVTLAALGFYLYAVLIIWKADWLQDRSDQPSLQASGRLEPWDAQTQWLLGRYFLHVDQDAARALVSLRRAVELDPYDGLYWLDLAGAYHLRGNSEQNRVALEEALRAEPTSPVVAWEAANLYVAQDDISSALPLFRIVLEYDPRKTDTAVDLCWRATKNVSLIVSHALPPQPAAYFALLKLLVAHSETTGANELWHALMAANLTFRVADAFPYFDYLIQTEQIEQATRVWADLSTLDAALPNDSPPNLVRNSSFETKFLDGGFDWRLNKMDGVDISQDETESHNGRRALRIAFAGPALADVGLYQYVPVQPSAGYRFSAFAKTQDIDTASGPRLAVADAAGGNLLSNTDEFLDTSDWRQRTIDFVTGPETHLVKLRVVRTPGDRLIKGTLWLDDVKLEPAPVTTGSVATQ